MLSSILTRSCDSPLSSLSHEPCFALPVPQVVPCACHCKSRAATRETENLCTHQIPRESRAPSGLAGTELCVEQSSKSPTPRAGRGAADSADTEIIPIKALQLYSLHKIPKSGYLSACTCLGHFVFPYWLERALLVEAGKELSWHS